jgi:glutathione synthase/RimK-type ligase-like ATP-grasp enzyme
MSARVALATCSELSELDEDERRVLEPLADLGVEAEPRVWDDPEVDWEAFDLTVVRSTWDYVGRREQFLAWAESVPRLHNPAEVLRWNTDKRYLAELADAGLPVVPTWFDEVPDLDGELVVKPTESAGARDTGRFASAADAAELAESIRASGRTAMAQPYLDEIDEHGETGLVFMNGAYSHAFRKGPLLPLNGPPVEGLFAFEHITPREPSPGEREVAQAVMDWVQGRFGAHLYARVDVAPPGVLLELEVTEPSLFLGQEVGAPRRLAEAIAALL